MVRGNCLRGDHRTLASLHLSVPDIVCCFGQSFHSVESRLVTASSMKGYMEMTETSQGKGTIKFFYYGNGCPVTSVHKTN